MNYNIFLLIPYSCSVFLLIYILLLYCFVVFFFVSGNELATSGIDNSLGLKVNSICDLFRYISIIFLILIYNTIRPFCHRKNTNLFSYFINKYFNPWFGSRNLTKSISACICLYIHPMLNISVGLLGTCAELPGTSSEHAPICNWTSDVGPGSWPYKDHWVLLRQAGSSCTCLLCYCLINHYLLLEYSLFNTREAEKAIG